MPVVRHGNDQSVEVLLLLVEHLPEIPVACGSGELLENPGSSGTGPVEVAHRDDLLRLTAIQIDAAHAADAHSGNREGIARRLKSRTAQRTTRHDKRRQTGGHHSPPAHRPV